MIVKWCYINILRLAGMEKSFLDSNLKKISKYNEPLCNKILNHQNIHSKFEFVQAQSGDINFIYENIPLHDDKDPQQEALNICKRLPHNEKNTIHIIFGLGLGYLLKRFTLNCPGKIIVLEPNLDILRITLEVVDLSEELSNPNVIIAETIKDIEKSFESLYFEGTEVTLNFTNNYFKLNSGKIDNLINELSFIKGLYASNYSNLFDKCHEWTFSGIQNIPETLSHFELESLRGSFKNKPAVIVSAGPSLDKNIHHLVKYRDKIVLFSVGTALKAVCTFTMKPDFLIIVEHSDCFSQLAQISVDDMNLIVPPSAHIHFHNLPAKRTFNYYPNNDLTSKWLAQYLNVDLKDYHNKGTVSLCAVFSSMILGCNPIILIGQDLAYTSGKCYSSHTAYHNLICSKNGQSGKYEVSTDNLDNYLKTINTEKEEAIKITNDRFDELNKNLFYVKGQNGEVLPTDPGYATFIRYFENTAQEYRNRINFINSTEGGAYLEGFKHIPLEEALKKYANEAIDIDKIIEEQLKTTFSLIKEKKDIILQSLNETLSLIEQNYQTFQKGKDVTLKLKKLFKLRRFHDKHFKKYFEDALFSFIELEKNLIKNNLLVIGSIFPEYSKLSNHLINSRNQLDLDSIGKAINLLNEFFVNPGCERLNKLIHFLKVAKDKLDKVNESSYTESKAGIGNNK